MEHAKKMALIPQSMLETMTTQQQLSTTPVQNLMSTLDYEMQRILNDGSIPADVKAKQYNQALNRYLVLRNKVISEPLRVSLEQPSNEHKLLEHIPIRFAAKARLLLDHIRDNPDIQWNERQELVYKGRRIPGSNSTDLVQQFTKPPGKRQRKVTGWREFGKALLDHNVPRSAVGNYEIWRQIEHDEDPVNETDEFADAVDEPIDEQQSPTTSGQQQHPASPGLDEAIGRQLGALTQQPAAGVALRPSLLDAAVRQQQLGAVRSSSRARKAPKRFGQEGSGKWREWK